METRGAVDCRYIFQRLVYHEGTAYVERLLDYATVKAVECRVKNYRDSITRDFVTG